MLDDLELPQVQEIGTYDVRTLAEHKPPGADGSHLQNLGRRPTRIAFWGVATGPEASGVIDQLEQKFRAGAPMDFVADITSDSAIEKVLIDDVQLQDVAGVPERTAYVVTLRQFIEPVEPEDTSLLDTGILDDAASLMDQLVDGLALAQAFGTGLEQFVDVLSGFLARLRA
jgi:hypothetical protein